MNTLALYAGVVSFICAVWIIYWTVKLAGGLRQAKAGALANDAYFLFDGDRLIKTSQAGRQLLKATKTGAKDWSGFHACFGLRFPKLPARPPDLDAAQELSFDGADGARLQLQAVGRYWRVTLVEIQTTSDGFAAHRLFVIGRQHQQLHTICHNMPYVVWQTSTDDVLLWQNKAYSLLRDAVGGRDDRSLFDLILSEDQTPAKNRQSLHLLSKKVTMWYDIVSILTQGIWTHYASDINEIIKAETAQQNFVQTLGKTFAEMSIGLAVFDQNHRLVLFNPALIDLTSLGAEFLSGRPVLTHFFNKLRENRIMPEPRNSAAWRCQLQELISRSNQGAYCATWQLPNGLTYRVRGRPHPDGALAFLFENISAEISLTRRFRAKLAGLGSIIENLETAVVVFDNSGRLKLSNPAYTALWADIEGAAPDAEGGAIIEVSRSWQAACLPTPVWGDLREYVVTIEGRERWAASVTRDNGDTLYCSVSPLPDSATMVCFQSRETCGYARG